MASLCLTTPNSQSPSSCQIHPLALFSILSSHTSRPATATRVIGTLLGRIVAGNAKTANRVIEVTSSFAVPFKQSPSGEVSFDAVYQRQMVAMQSAITSNEVVVGWFTTSPDGSMIGEESSLIHDFYADECEDPIHLVVDTSLSSDATSISAFVATPLSVQGVALANMFTEIAIETKTSDCEKIFIDNCVKDLVVPGEQAVSSKGSEDNLEASMDKLLALLKVAAAYVTDVVAGKKAADNNLGRGIADALAAVPRLQPAAFEKLFNDNLQDLLMVMYLSKLTKTQLTIAEKLTATITI